MNGHYCSYEDACNNYGAEGLLFTTDSAPRMSRGLCNENCNRAHYLTLNDAILLYQISNYVISTREINQNPRELKFPLLIANKINLHNKI